ncbi:galectin-4-like isoform X2 [Tachysurus fulvidraco]|uniref:galectin-4-like isoform X2 n=1 Tax=Tachysurus fulvidraco TaxID=1234273 RepID=UPI001FEDEE02|nr:galectin-4-like isoform X2 [Tachysurus fulvidraco]
MKIGMALCFQGVLFERDRPFFFSLRTGPGGNDDIAFNLSLHPNNYSECRIGQNRSWANSVKYFGCPLSRGSHFVFFIVITQKAYEVYLDGRKYCSFNHHIPVDKVKGIHIYGFVNINSVGFVSNWSASSFGKEQHSGIPQWELSNIQSDIKYPLCKPKQPYLYPIPGGLKPGLALFFQGVVPLGSKGYL